MSTSTVCPRARRCVRPCLVDRREGCVVVGTRSPSSVVVQTPASSSCSLGYPRFHWPSRLSQVGLPRLFDSSRAGEPADHRLASFQSSPVPMSTPRGGSSGRRCSSLRVRAPSPRRLGVGNSSRSSSCTCSTSLAALPSSRRRRESRPSPLDHIAAVPCMTEFTASRSPRSGSAVESDLGNRPPAAEQRRHVAVPRRRSCALDEVLHVRKRPVGVDAGLRLLARISRFESPEAGCVDDPEVHHLGDVALVLRQRRRSRE